MNETSDSPAVENRPSGGRLVPLPQSVPTETGSYGYGYGYGRGGPYGVPDESGIGTKIFEYWRILNKRKWVILSVLFAFVAIGVVMTLMKTPIYTATVRLQIDPSTVKVVQSGDLNPMEGYDPEFMKTQLELLNSGAVSERVASALKLGDDADFFAPRDFSVLGAIRGLFASKSPSNGQAAANQAAAAGIVSANRVIRVVPGSRLVDVSYNDPSPVRAQRIAMATADAFVNSNIDKRFQANSFAKVFLEDQAKQLKMRLEESEKTLLEFGQKEQIVAVTEKSNIAETNLASANATLGNLVAERIKNEGLWKQAESAKAVNLPQFLSNGVIDGLRAKRKELESEYQQKLETFKPSYPAMVQISNKMAEIDRQLASEVNTIKLALKGAYESNLNMEVEMRKRIETLRGDVLDLQKRSIEYNILKREVDTNRTLYDGLLQRYKEVDIAGGMRANNVFIVDKAAVPGSPSSPQMSRALLVSLALGSAAGLGAAFLLEQLDDTVRTADELERTTGLTTLGIIPKNEGRADLNAELANPRSHISEACRSLCTALQFSTDTGLPKTLLVTSSGPGEGKSTTAMVIGKHFATLGLKVLLVDCDLRKPSMHVKLGLNNASGLTNYLTGALSPPEVIQSTGVPNLTFIASGPLPPNAADLLGSARMLSLLSVGAEVFDLIIIDSPPVMGLADAPLLSSVVAATIFVTGAGQVRTGFVRNAIKRLQFARGSVIGAVITKFDAKRDVGYGYGYGYGYGLEYGQEHGDSGAEPEPSKEPPPSKIAKLRKRAASKLQASG